MQRPVLVGDPFLALDRLEVAELLDTAGRGQVVEDRLVPGEALEAHDLLREQRAVVTELNVALARHVAEALVERHGEESSAGPYRGGCDSASSSACYRRAPSSTTSPSGSSTGPRTPS